MRDKTFLYGVRTGSEVDKALDKVTDVWIAEKAHFVRAAIMFCMSDTVVKKHHKEFKEYLKKDLHIKWGKK